MTFTITYTPVLLDLKLNGLSLTPVNDYSISGTTITFVTAPNNGDTLRAVYWT
jgi:hypothetical protein